MDYKDSVKSLIEKYFNDILVRYKEVAMAATKDSKKLAMFKKIKYDGHIENFRDLEQRAKDLGAQVENLVPPEDDKESAELKEKFENSLDDFVKLCVRNEDHYDLMDRKQYAKNKVSLDDFKLSLTGVNTATVTSVTSLNTLEQAYMIYIGEAKAEDYEDTSDDDTEEVEGYDEEFGHGSEEPSYINANDTDPDEEDVLDEELHAKPRVYKKQNFEDEE